MQLTAHWSLLRGAATDCMQLLSAASTAAAAAADAQATNNRERSFRPRETARCRLAEFYWL